MDVIFKARHTELQERFRRHVSEKLGKLEKLDHRPIRVDVEVCEEHNPRQSDQRERVGITVRSPGPVIRAQAAADDRYTAFDQAIGKLGMRLRRLRDRNKAARHGVLSAGHAKVLRAALAAGRPAKPRPGLDGHAGRSSGAG